MKPMSQQRGRFITFEGIDGAGKSTQLQRLVEHLTARGLAPVQTREPGGTPAGEALRALVLTQPMHARAETLVMFAARAEHLVQVIEPALTQGRWVICDRFTDATYAYQCGGRGLTQAEVAVLEQWVHPELQPDLTFLVDIDPTVAAARLAQARAADRFEAESVAFFTRVRNIYLERAAGHPERFCVLNGANDAQHVQAQIAARVAPWLER